MRRVRGGKATKNKSIKGKVAANNERERPILDKTRSSLLFHQLPEYLNRIEATRSTLSLSSLFFTDREREAKSRARKIA
ncbi:hypothetical protein RJT34_04389 [Clitoria ternatea]|uniref:Uncharacterized protein n=1 Tax=Clitoria ternatea TaxID=43366 RepID=A0AAN9KMJ2_CLITE